MMTMTEQAAREAIAAQLLNDAAAHETARFDEIGRRFDSLERALPAGGEGELVSLQIALTFWDGWIDARNRGFQTTSGIQPNEWPALARSVAADLLADRPITDARVQAGFDAAGPGDRVRMIAARLRDRGVTR